jgi:hypothetical protein
LIVNTDTFVVVNKEQVYKINLVYEKYNSLKDYSVTLNNRISTLNKKVGLMNQTFLTLRGREDKLILENVNLKDLNEINNNLIGKYREEVKYQKSKVMKVGFFSFVAGAVLGSFIVILVK